jgi:NADH dehydrogenase
MGRVLVETLINRGHKVRVLTLPGDPNASRVEQYGAEVRYGDIGNREDLKGMCEGVEVVYHLAAVIIAYDNAVYQRINVEGTRYCVEEAQRAGVKHFIYVSSASVVYPKSTRYSRSKQTAERIVSHSNLNHTIVRPTLVYAQRGGQEFDLFLNYLRSFPIVPFIGKGQALKRPVHVEDIIEGLLRLPANATAYGKTYNFSGGEVISMIDFARLCLRLMGMERKPILRIPVGVCMVLSAVAGVLIRRSPLRWPVIAGVTQDANLDPIEANRDLGYAPVGVREKLPECFPRKNEV